MLYVKGFLVALQGVPVTVGVTLIAMVTGVVLGLVLALMKMSRIKVLTALASLYIEIIRGTPMIVQALIMAYGLPQLLQSSGISFRWPYLIIPAVIVCGLNSAAYVAEVIRSGIQAVDKGQMEAARSLGMSYMQAMRTIILPQAFRRMLPALGNNAIAILKDSSLISAIGLAELAYAARTVAGASARYWEPYITISCVYWVMTLLLAWGIRRLEARLGRGDNGIGS